MTCSSVSLGCPGFQLPLGPTADCGRRARSPFGRAYRADRNRSPNSRHCLPYRRAHIRLEETISPARCRQIHLQQCSGREIVRSKYWPCISLRTEVHLPRRNACRLRPPCAANSHSASVGRRFPRPLCIGVRIIPGDLNHRMILAALKIAPRSLGMLPIGPFYPAPPGVHIAQVYGTA